ncbi:glycosyltransferase family 2 protein [Pedobacter sp. R-06]|uniref:glycosyltransferase family 2 protein n=1 Tax=Pedobacter sp. R-06 TaxID=3404051 RepID=UPI003CEDD554
MRKPQLSVIIPCYNAGEYLPEAIQSLKHVKDDVNFEIIVVNDGSDDISTLTYLQSIANTCKVVHQENQGPASARNNGIKNAAGEYLLFLDSDNKIRNGYLEKAIDILNNDKGIAVVYGQPHFFGEENLEHRKFNSAAFDLHKLSQANYIDMCAIVRKKTMDKVGGFDENRFLIGNEDWDLWLNIGINNYKFHFINEVLFDYRIRKNSLHETQSEKANRFSDLQLYFFKKYPKLYLTLFNELRTEKLIHENDKQRPFRSFIKYLYSKYFK